MQEVKYTKSEVKTVLKNYKVGKLIRLKRTKTGHLNVNLKLKTTKGKYLFKKYHLRFFPFEQRKDEHKLLRYLHRKGIPVVPPVMDRRGETIHRKGDVKYVIFPWIDSYSQPKKMTGSILRDAAQNLARLHRALKSCKIRIRSRIDPWPDDIRRCIMTFDENDEFDKNLSINKFLRNKKRPDAFDRYVASREKGYLGLRKELLNAGKTMRYKDYTIVHYDYSPQNQLYDKHGRIIAIIDFDQVHRDLAQLDLLKAVRFFAENNSETKLDFRKAKYFIREYRKKNPIKLRKEDAYYFLLYIVMRRLYYMLELYYNKGWPSTKRNAKHDFKMVEFIIKNKKKLETLA